VSDLQSDHAMIRSAYRERALILIPYLLSVIAHQRNHHQLLYLQSLWCDAPERVQQYRSCHRRLHSRNRYLCM